jgi:hypothetical protein
MRDTIELPAHCTTLPNWDELNRQRNGTWDPGIIVLRLNVLHQEDMSLFEALGRCQRATGNSTFVIKQKNRVVEFDGFVLHLQLPITKIKVSGAPRICPT